MHDTNRRVFLHKQQLWSVQWHMHHKSKQLPERQILDCSVIRYTEIVALLCTSQANLSWHLGHWIFRPCNNAAIPNSTCTFFGRRPMWSQMWEPFKMPRILALTPMYKMEITGAKARKSRQQWFIKLDFIYLFWLRKKNSFNLWTVPPTSSHFTRILSLQRLCTLEKGKRGS